MQNPWLVMFTTLLLSGSVPAGGPISDIEYTSPGSTDSYLDVYLPDGGIESGTPTVLFIHGGGWYGGDKTEAPGILYPLANAGYGVVSCNYTLSTDMSPSYPQAVHDVKAVVLWIRMYGAAYGLSPTIAVTGPSAGGHLAEMLATTAGVDIFEPQPEPVGGYGVQATIPFWGLSDFVMQVNEGGDTGPFMAFLGGPYNADTAATYIEASPLTWVSPDDPPMHQVHGYDDPIHFHAQAEVMHDALVLLGVPSSINIFPGGHSFGDYEYEGVTGFPAAAATLIDYIPILLALGRTADIDGDGSVGFNDILFLISSWGSCSGLPVDCPADIDGSGSVDFVDLLEVLSNWS